MCTNILLNAPVTPGKEEPRLHVSARVMELPGYPTSMIYQVPRGQQFPLAPPPLRNPLIWKNTYGFVGIAKTRPEFDVFPIFADGLNEEGMSCGALWLAGAVYPKDEAGAAINLFYSDFVAWVLGNFASVIELEAALDLGRIHVVNPLPSKDDPLYLPLHFIAIDKTGASLVVEFIDGIMRKYGPSYDSAHKNGLGASANGVLTNGPGYDWQRTNLEIYSNLTPTGTKTSTSSVYPFVGSGLVGMPGDSTPPARFVRGAMIQHSLSMLEKNGDGWLPAPWHHTLPGRAHGYADSVQALVNIALQAVQVVMATPYGTLLTPSSAKGAGATKETLHVGDYSDWTVVRDHTHGVLYYVSAFNNIPQSIDLAALDFANDGDAQHFPHFPSIALLPPPPELGWHQDATKSFTPPAYPGSPLTQARQGAEAASRPASRQ
ncbi:linear amide C-N hydrolase [Dyella subtropica]|uniref:linear amide C-N hydrolase n=1 Tax=Dyella subtropica TaxID=2992127 RepID=UPI00225045B7|nr:linear amide C-N hydrolase [Dyella subtropica]